MPYEIQMTNQQHCVVNSDTGETIACHPTHAAAQAQLAALYANVDDATSKAYRASGDAVKRLKGNRFGGYVVRFTNAQRPDLVGEYFDDATDYMLSVHPLEGVDVLYHHAEDETVHAIPIGKVEHAEYQAGKGIWIETTNTFAKYFKDYIAGLKAPADWKAEQEARAQEYQDMLDEMIDRGLFGWSSGALPKSVLVEDGHIKRWVIKEASLTPSPAEPTGTQVHTLKALFAALFREPQARETGAEPSGRECNDDKMYTGANKMTPEELRQLIRAEVMAYLAEMESATEPVLAEGEQDTMANVMVDETLRQMADEEMKPEEMKAEQVKAMILKNLATIAVAGFNALNQARETERQGRAHAMTDVLKTLRQQPPISPKQEAGAGRIANGNGAIHVSETMKYAHLSAEEMALAIKLAAAVFPVHMQKGLKLQHLVDAGMLSEDFLRHATHKAVHTVKGLQPSNDRLIMQDHAAVKSAMPFKADELDAVAITNQGAEWDSVFYDTRLWERARIMTELFNMLVDKGMRTVDIPQGSRTMNVKLNTSSPTVFTRSEPRSTDATGRPEVTAQITPWGTSEVEVSANEHVIASSYSHQLDEDSIINVAQFLEPDMVQTLAESLEGTLINGDTTTTASSNINLIDGTPGTGLQAPDYLAWDGIRHTFLIDNTGQASNQGGVALTATQMESLVLLFPVEIVTRRSNMLWVMDYKTESSIRKFPELLTVDVAGESRATLFAGKIPPLFNIDPYMSGKLALSNTAGKISATSSNNLYGTLICVYAPYWQYGRKRDVTIETERYALPGATTFVASVRHILKVRGTNAAVGKYYILV